MACGKTVETTQVIVYLLTNIEYWIRVFCVGEYDDHNFMRHDTVWSGKEGTRFCLFLAKQLPQWALASSFTRFLDHTQRHTRLRRSPLDEWWARHRDIYLTTHNIHNRQTSIAPRGIRTHNLSRRMAIDLRFKPRRALGSAKRYT